MNGENTIPQQNIEIADHLSAKADKLPDNEKNKFRIIAYRKAAKSIRQETRNLWGVYRSTGLKGLEKIPGVGNKIAWEIVKKIQS